MKIQHKEKAIEELWDCSTSGHSENALKVNEKHMEPVARTYNVESLRLIFSY